LETEPQRNKIEAIYALREAVESKADAEHQLAADGSATSRDALLAAQLDVEAKTQDAIEVCHECGGSHSGAQSYHTRRRVTARRDNVVSVDFSHPEGF
jgi:hypothetical protein